MADDGFNGTTLTFPDTTESYELLSADFSETVEKISVTNNQSTQHNYLPGISDEECSCEVVGVLAGAIASTGHLVITWNDGTVDSLGTAFISEKAISGSLDDKVTTSISFARRGTVS